MDSPEVHANKAPQPPQKNLEQVEAEVSAEVDAQIKTIKDAATSEANRQENMDRLGNDLRRIAQHELDELRVTEEASKDRLDKNKIIREKKEQVADKLRRVTISASKGIKVNENIKTQALIAKLAEQSLSDFELVDIFQSLNEYILGSKEITLGSAYSQEISEFENDMMNMESVNVDAVIKITEALASNASLFGREPSEIRKRFAFLNRAYHEQQGGNRQRQLIEEYFSNFTTDQREFIDVISNTDKFLEYINRERAKKMADSGELSHELKEMYHKKFKVDPEPDVLKGLIDRAIGIEISEGISRNVVNILEHMYRQLNIERSHKPFNEIENEDFLRGITTKRNVIMGALHGLESNLMILEDQNPNDPRLIKLQKMTEEDAYTAEIDYEGNKRRVPRIKPLPYFKEVNLSEFITGQWSNFNHWREKTGYFHDVGVVYTEPPHEGSFYGALKGFAGRMSSAALDGLFNLPDAEITIHAFHLYEKFMQEAMATVDHRIVPHLHTNQLEGINTQVEEKVKKYLKKEFSNEISLTSAINNAVGLAKGVFLTDPENIAYCDPTNAVGSGAAVAYGTIDATPENVLSGGLHTIMRWQGTANLRAVLFLPLEGEKQGFWSHLIGGGNWDHTVAMKSARDYLESFYNGKMGREGSKRNLVIDKLLNLTRTADFMNRGGWRDYHRYSSHFMYDKDGKLQLLDSFKSLDMIGYDPVNWFLRKLDSDVDITKTTYLEKLNGPEAEQREALFLHIYKEYFLPFHDPILPNPKPEEIKQEYDKYVAGLRVRAETMVKNRVKEKGTLSFDYDRDVQKQISDLFIQGTISRFVAARFPTKFLRIDKDRLHSGGKSRYTQTFEEMGDQIFEEMGGKEFEKIGDEIFTKMGDQIFEKMGEEILGKKEYEKIKKIGGELLKKKKQEIFDENKRLIFKKMRREIFEKMEEDITEKTGYKSEAKLFNINDFSSVMSDLEYVEEFIRLDTSRKIKKNIHMLPHDLKDPNKNSNEDPNQNFRSLGEFSDVLYNLDRSQIRRIMELKKFDKKEIDNVEKLYDLIMTKIKGKSEILHDAKGNVIPENLDFLDGEGWDAIEKFPFNIGVENTDMSLIAFRGSGPRPVARAIGDMATMEEVVIKGFLGLPEMFKKIAIDGNYEPLLDYLHKCQLAFYDVHGVGNDYEFNYMVGGMLKNYLRRDDKVQGFMGLGRAGTINSIAGMIAGSSNAVHEWDVRDMMKFDIDMMKHGLLPGENYDTTKGPEKEKIWKIDKKTGIPVETGLVRTKQIYPWNLRKFKEDFGSGWKDSLVKGFKEILPLLLVWMAYQYIKKALEETFGAKKG